MARKSLKNSKHLAELIEAVTLPTLTLLAQVDRFAFLEGMLTETPEVVAKLLLTENLSSRAEHEILLADVEASRLLQLARFRTEELLEHAYSLLEIEAHADLPTFPRTADAMTRLCWLRVKAARIFDQIETFYLTHHFFGHKKFLGFTLQGGEGRAFVWTDEIAQKLHQGVADILALDDEAKANCDIVHFEMEEGDAADKRQLHYVVVYHPGKMRTLRHLKDKQRDLLLYTPALEATLVYDPAKNEVHVLSDQKTTAKRLADQFALVGFDKPLSKQPLNAIVYDLTPFKQGVDLKAAKARGALILDGWISSLKVSLGHTRHQVTLALANNDNIWTIAHQHFGEHNPLTLCRSIHEVNLAFAVRFDGETTTRALDITVGERGSCNLLTLTNPRLRQCGEDILTSLGLMKRIEPAKVGADLALFRAEMTLLELAVDEVDGYLLASLHLPVADLLAKGLLKKKTPGDVITLPVKDTEGQSGFRCLHVESNSTATWACDAVSGERFELSEGDLCRYAIDKAYLRERLGDLLTPQLESPPLEADKEAPFLLGYYRLGNQCLPVIVVSRLWDAKHADKMDTTLRHWNLGLSIVISTTPHCPRRFLGTGIVVPVDALVVEEQERFRLELSRAEGEVRRRQALAVTTDIPTLIKEDSRNALLIGPWPDPWSLTKKEWIDVVEILVSAWTSNKKKCTKPQLEAASHTGIRSMREFFKDAPEWTTYIRGADGNNKPRLWELNIGQSEHASRKAAAQNASDTPVDTRLEEEEML